MNSKTHELYDEDDYFLKFLNIHPILTYSNNKIDNKKKDFQLFLLNKLHKNEITYDMLKNKYNLLSNC